MGRHIGFQNGGFTLHGCFSIYICRYLVFFDQTPSVQASFVKDVRSLVGVIEEMGNPFEEDSQDLVILDTKNIAGPAAVETVMNAKRIGQEQFEAFTRKCLLDRTSDISTPPNTTQHSLPVGPHPQPQSELHRATGRYVNALSCTLCVS